MAKDEPVVLNPILNELNLPPGTNIAKVKVEIDSEEVAVIPSDAPTVKADVTVLTDEQRDIFKKVKLDKETVIALFAEGLTIWQATERAYDFAFDHSDRRTWLFYQKVNTIRKANGIESARPNYRQRYPKKCPHCGKGI